MSHDPTSVPRHYAIPWVARAPELTGRIDDPLWAAAPWTEDFVDILGGSAPTPRYRTRVKMLWCDDGLIIGAELEEPHVWATYREHDSVIFQENDFEVFIDPDGDCQLYAELEMNAMNTTWDLLLTKPYRAGGAPINSWEIRGLRTAVFVDGTLNDPSDVDHGWTAEIFLPWYSYAEISRSYVPPKPGDQWRINFSRVQWQRNIVNGAYAKKPGLPEDNWVWSPQGVIDMHRPERWGYATFAKDGVGLAPKIEPEPAILADRWQAQRDFRSRKGRWAHSEHELGLPTTPGLRIELTTSTLEMTLAPWHIDQDCKLWRAS